jgi:hypothetical protein
LEYIHPYFCFTLANTARSHFSSGKIAYQTTKEQTATLPLTRQIPMVRSGQPEHCSKPHMRVNTSITPHRCLCVDGYQWNFGLEQCVPEGQGGS